MSDGMGSPQLALGPLSKCWRSTGRDEALEAPSSPTAAEQAAAGSPDEAALGLAPSSDPIDAASHRGMDSQLDVMVRMWHGGISPSLARVWLPGLRHLLSTALPQPLSVSTACSGTDIAVLCLRSLCSFWHEYYGCEVSPPHLVLSVEQDPAKREFIKAQHAPGCLVEDVNSLCNVKVLNHMNGQLTFVPFGRLFLAGFSCTSRTRMSTQSARNKGCTWRLGAWVLS